MADSGSIEPTYFIERHFFPANSATERAVEALRNELGLQNRVSSKEALSGFLVACRGLLTRQEEFLGFAGDKNAYGGPHRTYSRMKDALVDLGYLVRVRKGHFHPITKQNSVNTYRVLRFPDACRTPLAFEHRRPEELVSVRERKGRSGDPQEGRKLSQKECLSRFGTGFDIEVFSMKLLCDFLEQHPLVILGNSYKGLTRQFNDGRLDRGGRIFAGYSSLKKHVFDPETGEEIVTRSTARIDDEEVALIDISGSFLCICAGMVGEVVSKDEDPYARVPFVVNEESRKFAKVLVSAMIANGGKKKRYTKEMKEKHAGVIGSHKIGHFTSMIYSAFPFLEREIDGLQVMYKESCVMMRTLGRCVHENIPAWPLHDAIFVKRSDAKRAEAILSECFAKEVGFEPRLNIETFS